MIGWAIAASTSGGTGVGPGVKRYRFSAMAETLASRADRAVSAHFRNGHGTKTRLGSQPGGGFGVPRRGAAICEGAALLARAVGPEGDHLLERRPVDPARRL